MSVFTSAKVILKIEVAKVLEAEAAKKGLRVEDYYAQLLEDASKKLSS